MAKDFKLPNLGEEVDAGDVVSVLVSEGDEIEAEQTIIEIETDKATLEVPCSFGGTVAKVHVSEGDHVKVGDVLISVNGEAEPQGNGTKEDAEKAEKDKEEKKKKDADEEGQDEDAEESEPQARDRQKKSQKSHKKRGKKKDKEEDADEDQAQADERERKDQSDEDEEGDAEGDAEEESAPKEKKARGDAEEEDEEKEPKDKTDEKKSARGEKPSSRAGGADQPDEIIPAGPATRRLARELGVDLRRIAAAYPDARLTEQHVKAYVRERMRSESAGAGNIPVPPLPDFTRWGPVDRVPRTTLEKRIAQQMITAWSIAPHVTHCESADVSGLEAMRRRYAARAGERQPKLTMTAFLVKAAVFALHDYPKFNASFDPVADELILKHYYHIGVAVDTEAGLIVPVIRDCDRKSVLEIAADLEDVAQRTRDRKISPDELRGGTFTITNVGGIGGTVFTPILNYPEVAILGATRARPAGDGERTESAAMQPDQAASGGRLELPLCLSFDHRVINGADAARFAARVAEALADPEQMLLGA